MGWISLIGEFVLFLMGIAGVVMGLIRENGYIMSLGIFLLGACLMFEVYHIKYMVKEMNETIALIHGEHIKNIEDKK